MTALAGSRDRGEADRARAALLTLAGWTSPRIAEAFGVREDIVRQWRSNFMRDGIAALKAEPGGNIIVYGSGQLVHTLIEHDLVDVKNAAVELLVGIDDRQGRIVGHARAAAD